MNFAIAPGSAARSVAGFESEQQDQRVDLVLPTGRRVLVGKPAPDLEALPLEPRRLGQQAGFASERGAEKVV